MLYLKEIFHLCFSNFKIYLMNKKKDYSLFLWAIIIAFCAFVSSCGDSTITIDAKETPYFECTGNYGEWKNVEDVCECYNCSKRMFNARIPSISKRDVIYLLNMKESLHSDMLNVGDTLIITYAMMTDTFTMKLNKFSINDSTSGEVLVITK